MLIITFFALKKISENLNLEFNGSTIAMLPPNFSHLTILQCRRRTHITALQDCVGKQCFDQSQIHQTRLMCYIELFSTSQPYSSMAGHNSYYVPLSSSEICQLTQPLEKSEISLAIQSLNPFKAPGRDVLHPYFFQKYWHIVGLSVITFCQNAFTTGNIPEDVNNTLLSYSKS